MGETMTKHTGRMPYTVVSRYRSDGLWHEQGQALHLLPAQAAGLLSQGKIKPASKPSSKTTKTNQGDQ